MSERNLSCFFVKELLPLYFQNNIDDKRRDEIKRHLSSCTHCKSYYEKLITARETIFNLSETEISKDLLTYLKETHSFWSEVYVRIGWSKWPNSLKWGVELGLVTVALVSIIHFTPWIKFVQTVRNMRPEAPQALVTAAVTPAPTPVAVKEVASTLTPSDAFAENDEKTVDVEASGETEQRSKKESGFVWRGTLQVEDLTDEIVDRVTSTIADLGGTKAGEVELGWHRGNERYYHFILPEENYEKLLSVLNAEGLVELKKEKHPRIIKSGYMRIIMTLEEPSQ